MSEKQFVNPVDAKFTVPDYIVFSLMLGISCGIGIFHALTGGKQKTTLEFLMANRNMNPFPVGMSLVASFISAITFLGTPADNYKYGIGYWLYAFGYILVGLACWRFYIPIFYRMKITSANEVRFIFLLKKNKTTSTIKFSAQVRWINIYKLYESSLLKSRPYLWAFLTADEQLTW